MSRSRSFRRPVFAISWAVAAAGALLDLGRPLPAAAGESPAAADWRVLRDAQDAADDSFTMEMVAWTVLGLGTAAGATAVGLSQSNVALAYPVATGGGAMLLFGISGPVAAVAGAEARDGLALLDLRSRGAGLRTAGWIFYAISMGSGIGIVVAGSLEPSPEVGAAGAAPILSGLIATTLLVLDAGRDRRALERALWERHRPPHARVGNAGTRRS